MTKQKRLLSLIPSIEEDVYFNKNIKSVEDHYRESLQTYDCYELLRMIKSINKKKTLMVEQGKKLGRIDERYYNKAVELLCGELAAALNESKEAVKSCIEEKIKGLDSVFYTPRRI